jgi:hypothetical protein
MTLRKNVRIFRSIQLCISIIIFLCVFSICYFTTDFNITEIQLSKWGITENVALIWNSCLVLLGFSCFNNIYLYIKSHPRFKFKNYFIPAFLFQCVNIIFLGIVVSGNISHDVVAYIYFFTLPFTIYLFAVLNKDVMRVKEWIMHIALSSLMVALPLMTLFMFSGKAIPEIIHTGFFITWNLYILKEHK